MAANFDINGNQVLWASATSFADLDTLETSIASRSLDGINVEMAIVNNGGVITCAATIPTYAPPGAPTPLVLNAWGTDQFGGRWANQGSGWLFVD